MANSKSCLSADFAARLHDRLSRHVKPGQRLCIALSGGVDSVVLLHAVATMLDLLKLGPLLALHVHHNLSPNADEWECFCRESCARLGIRFESRHVAIHLRGEGIEAAARKARYAALESCDCDWIVLAHHRDDQAETVLLNLLRGAGVHGAAGMGERRGRLLRPMLTFSRAQVVAYARENDLPWIEDESNADNRYRRNFLRREVMPLLEQKFPQAAESLVRAAQAFADSAELLNQVAKEDLGIERRLKIAQLKALPASRANNLLAFYLRQHGLQIPSSIMLNEMLRQFLNVSADNDICFRIGENEVRCFQAQIWVDSVSGEVSPVKWNGESELDWGEFRIHSHAVIGDGIDSSLVNRAQLRFSTRQGGEVFQERQEGPHRPLKDLLREAGIPPWRRKSLPVLFARDEVVWVAGIGIACKYRCKPEAEGILIEFDGVTW